MENLELEVKVHGRCCNSPNALRRWLYVFITGDINEKTDEVMRKKLASGEIPFGSSMELIANTPRILRIVNNGIYLQSGNRQLDPMTDPVAADLAFRIYLLAKDVARLYPKECCFDAFRCVNICRDYEPLPSVDCTHSCSLYNYYVNRPLLQPCPWSKP